MLVYYNVSRLLKGKFVRHDFWIGILVKQTECAFLVLSSWFGLVHYDLLLCEAGRFHALLQYYSHDVLVTKWFQMNFKRG